MGLLGQFYVLGWVTGPINTILIIYWLTGPHSTNKILSTQLLCSQKKREKKSITVSIILHVIKNKTRYILIPKEYIKITRVASHNSKSIRMVGLLLLLLLFRYDKILIYDVHFMIIFLFYHKTIIKINLWCKRNWDSKYFNLQQKTYYY